MNHSYRLCPALFAAIVILLLGLSSCSSTKEIVYFQDVSNSDSVSATTQPKQVTIRPNDRLMIVVTTRDPLVTDMLNLPYVTRMLGTSSNTSGSYSSSQGMLTYSVDAAGNISFPVLGEVHVAGLTRTECAEKIKTDLETAGLAKDPTVTVDLMNTEFSVMGEVATPGRFTLNRDDMTILEALSAAKDLTIYGRRDNVKVVRTDPDGTQHTYVVDLTSMKDVAKSPAYYILPNDVIYVEPNTTRQRQSTVNGNNILSTSFWISVASLLTSVAVLIKR